MAKWLDNNNLKINLSFTLVRPITVTSNVHFQNNTARMTNF